MRNDNSRSTLEARFHTVMGRTIGQEISRVQFERARQLVAGTNLPLKQVAAQAGIGSVQYLSAVFETRLGMPPGDYRRRGRG